MSETPWLPYAAIHFLETILSPEMHVFEYGPGGSTLFLAKRVAHVVSVEHDAGYYREIESRLPANCECLLVPAEPGEIGSDITDPLAYRSADYYPDRNFRAYASAIDSYEPFDLVVVDGRARPSCLWHAHVKVKPGGYLLLDDSNRAYYLEKTAHLFDGWERHALRGGGPGDHVWEATIWKR